MQKLVSSVMFSMMLCACGCAMKIAWNTPRLNNRILSRCEKSTAVLLVLRPARPCQESSCAVTLLRVTKISCMLLKAVRLYMPFRTLESTGPRVRGEGVVQKKEKTETELHLLPKCSFVPYGHAGYLGL